MAAKSIVAAMSAFATEATFIMAVMNLAGLTSIGWSYVVAPMVVVLSVGHTLIAAGFALKGIAALMSRLTD